MLHCAHTPPQHTLAVEKPNEVPFLLKKGLEAVKIILLTLLSLNPWTHIFLILCIKKKREY